MRINIFPIVVLFLIYFSSSPIFGHGVSQEEKNMILEGKNLKYIYIGIIHMLKGYDHLLFLLGIVFLIKSRSQIIKLITAFTLGHSITLIFATINSIQVNSYIIESTIAFSVCYIAFVNLKGFEKLFNIKPLNTLVMVFIFGLIHGLGLSSILQQFPLKSESLLSNIISFNIGIEIGQLIAIFIIYLILSMIKKYSIYNIFKIFVNILIYLAGLFLCYIQIQNYLLNPSSQKVINEEKYKEIITINLPAHSEIEYKVWMDIGKELKYSWYSDNTKLYYDFHGDPASEVGGYFESFKEGTSSKDSGKIVSRFVGKHGWYWRNDSNYLTTIVLKLNGDYKLEHRK